MSELKLRAEQIQLGTPLPFDTFDEAGTLLLRRGFVIDDPQQLECLHSAQVLSVADRYGAMATGRAYRAAALRR